MSQYTQSKLMGLKAEQIREVALNEFQIGFTEDDAKAIMVEQILKVQDERAMTSVPPAPQSIHVTREGGVAVDIGAFEPTPDIAPDMRDDAEDRMWITIPKDAGPGGSDDVTVTVNGETCQIKRGLRVPIRMKFLRALHNTVQTHYHRDEQLGRLVSQEVPRFNTQVHGPAHVATAAAAA